MMESSRMERRMGLGSNNGLINHFTLENGKTI
jgi:hypothetical protein